MVLCNNIIIRNNNSTHAFRFRIYNGFLGSLRNLLSCALRRVLTYYDVEQTMLLLCFYDTKEKQYETTPRLYSNNNNNDNNSKTIRCRQRVFLHGPSRRFLKTLSSARVDGMGRGRWKRIARFSFGYSFKDEKRGLVGGQDGGVEGLPRKI